MKWLTVDVIYAILGGPCLIPIHMVPKELGIIMKNNKEGKEVQTKVTSSSRVCIDYEKYNSTTKKDYYIFINQILEKLIGQNFY